MISMIGEIKIPFFILFEVLSSLVAGFFIWRKRRQMQLKDEEIFNFVVLYIFLSFICGRIFYLLENFDEFTGLSWSIYPFYYDPGAERIWFKQMPWILVKFWDDGVKYAALLFGGVLYTLIYFRLRRTARKFSNLIVKALCYAQIVQIVGFFLAGDYLGKVTDLWIGVRFPNGDLAHRVPIQFFEIATLITILLISSYLKRAKKSQGILGLYLFVLGWLEVVVQFLIDSGGPEGGVNLIQLGYLFFVFSGILMFVFAFQKDFSVKSQDRDVTKIPSSVESSGTFRGSKLQFGYRDFQSSFSSYRKSTPSVVGWIRRKLSRLRGNLSKERRGENSNSVST